MTGLVILAEVMLMMVVVMVMLMIVLMMIVVMMISHPMTGLVILAEASRSPWSRCEERRRNDLMTISIRLQSLKMSSMSIIVIETLNPIKVNVMETLTTKCHQYQCQRDLKIQNVI